jgi:hypothetical protein
MVQVMFLLVIPIIIAFKGSSEGKRMLSSGLLKKKAIFTLGVFLRFSPGIERRLKACGPYSTSAGDNRRAEGGRGNQIALLTALNKIEA